MKLYTVVPGEDRTLFENLVLVASDDDSGGGGTSYLQDFPTTPNTYVLEVAAYSSSYSSADFTLTWSGIETASLYPVGLAWPPTSGEDFPNPGAEGNVLTSVEGEWVSKKLPLELPTGDAGDTLALVDGVWSSVPRAGYSGDWSPVAEYVAGSIVTVGSKTWIATQDITQQSVMFVGRTYADRNSSAAQTLVSPADTVVGDYQVLVISHINTVPSPAPSGFTLLYSGGDGDVTRPSKILFYGRSVTEVGSVSLSANGSPYSADLRTYRYVESAALVGAGYGLVSDSAVESGSMVLIAMSIWAQGMTDYMITPDPRLSNAEIRYDGMPASASLGDYELPSDGSAYPSFTTTTMYATVTSAMWGAVVFQAQARAAIFDPGSEWAPLGITSLVSRADTTFTTASLAAQAEATGTVALSRSYRLMKIVTSRPSWVRLYATAAHRTADAARTQGTAPSGDHGVIFEFVSVAGQLSKVLTPFVDGASMETVPTADIPISIKNTDTVAGTVSVTITWVGTE